MNASASPGFAEPSPEDQLRFLLRLYFGPGDDLLGLCVHRAYLDFSRTLHGIGKHPHAVQKASRYLHRELSHIAASGDCSSETGFDAWHKKTCVGLCDIYVGEGFTSFHMGQAQKWINMALKYVYVIGESRLPDYAAMYGYCHVPIDNILLAQPDFARLRRFKQAWSRIDTYDEYMEFQRAVRREFEGSSPLAVEFVLWQAGKSASPSADISSTAPARRMARCRDLSPATTPGSLAPAPGTRPARR